MTIIHFLNCIANFVYFKILFLQLQTLKIHFIKAEFYSVQVLFDETFLNKET